MPLYLLKRTLLFIPTVLAVMFIVYAVMEFSPGDPARIILGEGADGERIGMLRESLGLDRPFLLRFADYARRVIFKFDFGTSYRQRTPVIHDVWSKFPHTLILALWSVFLSALIGISLGVLTAVKQYSPLDTAAGAAALAFASIPGFLLGMILILIFSLGLGILPSGGGGGFRHYILPAAALAFPASGGILRLTRSMMLETLRADYVRTARAKGAGEGRVVLIHALRNALPPVITALGAHFGYLLGGAVVTETVFAMPGLGSHLVNAIRMKDVPVVLACTILLSVFFNLIMLLADICCAILDPRLQERYRRRGRGW